jgi:hypothetical protein
MEKATDDREEEMSTSSTSLDMSPNTLFHSSANGPEDVSLGKVPTFFYIQVRINVFFLYPLLRR